MVKTKNPLVQYIPSPNSTQTEPFESIVELYYQTQGYITSSNKWFWRREIKNSKNNKTKRGWQDIDVLAINEKETLIISVTVNLDDKVTLSGPKQNLIDYFRLAEAYLENVKEYSWLVKDRKVQKILVYESGYRGKTKSEEIIKKN